MLYKMKLRYLIITILMINSYSPAKGNPDLSSLMPDNLADWTPEGTDQLYNTTTLYDYIDGGAELYISYGMKEVVSRIYQNDSLGDIRIEIFDMVKPEDAFGVFSHTRTTDDKEFGQGSQYFTGSLIFWKDHYYIAITAYDDNEAIRQAIRSLASQIDQKIISTGDLPQILDFLPQEEFQNDSYIYFHHYIWQNAQYFIANDNFLNIDSTTQAVLERYGDRNNRIIILLVLYPDEAAAEDAREHFYERFLIHEEDSITEMQDDTWLGAISQGNLLACVFNCKEKEEALVFLNAVMDQYERND
jgi:hypothetical protein